MTASVAPRPAFGLPGRIQAPNSRPRSIALVGLGVGGAAVANSLARDALGAVEVAVFAAARPIAEDALATIKSNGDDLHRALRDADMIFVVARHGDDVGLAQVVARIARSRNAQVTALYIVPADVTGPDPALKALRAAAHMLVVASDESYVSAMVAALGS